MQYMVKSFHILVKWCMFVVHCKIHHTVYIIFIEHLNWWFNYCVNFVETKPGSSLCKPGTIALFGNVVYSGLLNKHFWHPVTKLVSFKLYYFSPSVTRHSPYRIQWSLSLFLKKFEFLVLLCFWIWNVWELQQQNKYRHAFVVFGSKFIICHIWLFVELLLNSVVFFRVIAGNNSWWRLGVCLHSCCFHCWISPIV